nr:hypothetical protein [Paenibacillus turpanensis]
MQGVEYREHIKVIPPLRFEETLEPDTEITEVSTNTVSQWCLNTIVCLELIGDMMEG